MAGMEGFNGGVGDRGREKGKEEERDGEREGERKGGSEMERRGREACEELVAVRVGAALGLYGKGCHRREGGSWFFVPFTHSIFHGAVNIFLLCRHPHFFISMDRVFF